MEMQSDLSEFFRPITETQKATTREITEDLKPIKEGIKELPQAMQPTDEAPEKEELVGELAATALNRPNRDTNFGIRKEGMHHYIGNKHAIIANNDIILDGETIMGTPGLWELLTSKNPQNYDKAEDYASYRYLMLKTNAIHKNNDPKTLQPKGNHKGEKWENIIGPIWHKEIKPKKKEGYEGEGVVVIPSDHNALLERLDLLLASQEAGHTGVGNELVSICDELKRQGVLDTKTFKK